MMGTARNMPTTPQRVPQTDRDSSMINGLMFALAHDAGLEDAAAGELNHCQCSRRHQKGPQRLELDQGERRREDHAEPRTDVRPKTIVPARAGAKVSSRLVGNQDPNRSTSC